MGLSAPGKLGMDVRTKTEKGEKMKLFRAIDNAICQVLDELANRRAARLARRAMVRGIVRNKNVR